MNALSVFASMLVLSAPAGEISNELRPPVPVLVDGKPLDVGREGHSAPFVGDFDGDGRCDLLVGQYHEGRLRIYRNHGDNARPRFQEFTWFQANGKLGRIPEG
jgi:hypothetical protein